MPVSRRWRRCAASPATDCLVLRELLVREIRAFRPDAVISTDPDTVFRKQGRGINHTDHRAAGLAAADAIFPAARNPMTFPHLVREGLLPHRVRRLYLGSLSGGVYVLSRLIE